MRDVSRMRLSSPFIVYFGIRMSKIHLMVIEVVIFKQLQLISKKIKLDIIRRNIILRVGKNSGPVLSRLWTEVYEILGHCGLPFAVSNFISDCLSCFVPKIFAVKIAVKLRIHRKTSKIGGFGPRIFREQYTPDFGHAFSNHTQFRACGHFWLSFVQRARRVADIKRK